MTKGDSTIFMVASTDGTLKVNGEVYKFKNTDDMEKRAREMLEEKIEKGYRVVDEETEDEKQRNRDRTTLRAYAKHPEVLRRPSVRRDLGYLYPEFGLTRYLSDD